MFAVSAALLPFVVIGTMEAAANGRATDAMIFGFVGLLLVLGVGAPIVSVVGVISERRRR
ncbi:hypothetical protein [Microbacterium radiodurans]|uniref:Uncharacterized protein n=1 Tax=Microbacterium radiodurans TaxID=661398 RepID=A0A5J5IP67_9MICO|nr:hypothetical protein [Microbacterium radiodurans]KAA9085232.1 hypothetical protein F6B42_12165 [Microbacterium radiodurans]